MTLKRITMQEIADACGVSRNTVSKIFNGRGSVTEATRKMVLEKARELGYYQFPMEEKTPEAPGGNIAVLTQLKLLSHNFGAYFITSFTDHISRAGYSIQMYKVPPEEIAAKALPPSLDLKQTAGILGIELFDREYIDMVCSLQMPTVFVDGYARTNKALIGCDFVSMENISSEIAIVKRMIDAGARRLGFLGDFMHCNSFYERWVGFCTALSDAGLPVNRDFCILKEDSDLYKDVDWLLEQLEAMPEIPDAFACANDFLGIHLISALKKKGLSVPEDVMVAGFDGSPEASFVEPSLTTAKIPSTEIGMLAASLLTGRIRMPEFPFHWTYVKTTPIWGNSTSREKSV